VFTGKRNGHASSCASSSSSKVLQAVSSRANFLLRSFLAGGEAVLAVLAGVDEGGLEEEEVVVAVVVVVVELVEVEEVTVEVPSQSTLTIEELPSDSLIFGRRPRFFGFFELQLGQNHFPRGICKEEDMFDSACESSFRTTHLCESR